MDEWIKNMWFVCVYVHVYMDTHIQCYPTRKLVVTKGGGSWGVGKTGEGTQLYGDEW